MKIRDYKNLNLFISMLFEFLEKNRISSSIMPVKNYRGLFDTILESEYTGYNCQDGIESYTIYFKPDLPIEDSEIYMFLFGEKEKERSCYVMIEMMKSDEPFESRLSLSWHEDKLPPHLADFRDNSGMLKTENYDGISESIFSDDEIMGFEEFKSFLTRNRTQKDLRYVIVD